MKIISKETQVAAQLFVPTKNKKRGIKPLPNFLSDIMIGKEIWVTTLFSILSQERDGEPSSHLIFFIS
jgi:hypothetical protein